MPKNLVKSNICLYTKPTWSKWVDLSKKTKFSQIDTANPQINKFKVQTITPVSLNMPLKIKAYAKAKNKKTSQSFVNFLNAYQTFLKKESLVEAKNKIRNYGLILNLNQGVIRISGLQDAFIGEILIIGGHYYGMVTTVAKFYIQALLFTHDQNIERRMLVRRSHRLVNIEVGFHLLGNIVDCLGNVLTSPHTQRSLGVKPRRSYILRTLEIKAPGIVARESISDALTTGILSVDAVVPIGRGQRELILGDRNVGKTSLATTCIINQKTLHMTKLKAALKPVYCVYVAIGQKISAVSRIASLLKKENCFFFTVIVAATASEPASMQFLAPYTGCAIGEWFRDRIAHSLVIYDDLSSQATAYRQLALLLRRPPGREAYPGDIFYLHSRLLERAGKLVNLNNISSTLTALPIVQTFDGEISAFIPTNVISITDGQIYLDPTLFHNGFAPAVSFKLSVSRVGSNAQLKVIKKIAFRLKNVILNYQDLASFSAIDTSAVPQYIRTILIKGSQISLILQQEQAFQSILQTQYFNAQSALYGAYNKVRKDFYPDFKDFLLSQFYLDDRWSLNGAITAGFIGPAELDEKIRTIIFPAFLFDKTNLFFSKNGSAQRTAI